MEKTRLWKAMERKLGAIPEQIEEFMFSGIAGASGGAQLPEVNKLNDSVYEFYSPPDGTSPNVEIVFFHGLELGDSTDAYVETWTSSFDSTSFYWPQTWLPERFPRARILSVSYDSSIRKGTKQGRLDLYCTAENLLQDLMDENGRVAAQDGCPLLLVGKDLGGLVIKAICLRAEKDRKTAFLSNLKGIFYYSTPHLGLPELPTNYNGALAKRLTVGDDQLARLNNDFRVLRSQYKWAARAIFAQAGAKKCQIVIPEASVRNDVDQFYTVNEDVDAICKPQAKTSSGFTRLAELINSVVEIQEDCRRRNEIRQQEEARERQVARERDEALPHNHQHFPNQMFGMDSRLQQVERMLQNCRTVGIVGMGGVGKTSLAMATFNKVGSTFEYTCFVRDMKLIMESIGQVKEKVRKELWKRMHCKGKEVGDKEQWFKLKDRTLLLVLDNVVGDQDCEVLREIANDTSPHSRFIATSRNRDHLYSLDAIYKVPFLDDNDAEEFFLSQAFPNHVQPSPQLTHIKDIVKKCDGLPLTIQVLGRYLNGNENDEHWRQTVDALGIAESASTFDERLWAKLRTSYEGLTEKEKQMFLDASTFFSSFNSYRIHSWTLREAKAAWKAAYKTSCETVLWKTLVDRSLVYPVEDHERIKVHEQLQSLGRRIASEPNNNSQRRVWEESVAMALLQESSEPDNQEYHAFRLARPSNDLEEITIPRRALRKFKSLKYLDFLGPVVIDEADDSESFPSEVVLLRCSGLQVFNPNHQRHLVVLNLDLGVQSLPCSIGRLQCLRIFALRAPKLKSLPDEIGDLSQLEFLEFSHLECLQDLPITFGKLSKIKHLIFKSCYKLHALPECFGSLSSLKHLEFHYCPKLHALPDAFCHLSIERLEFTHCEQLTSLPGCFGELTALKHLELLALCNLDSLPDSFGQLGNLQYLKLSAGAERRRGMITKLPVTLAKLVALRHLILDGISVTSLPESMKRMPSLQTLELKDLLYVKEVPSWFVETHGAPLALSHKFFQIQDGSFALNKEDSIRLAEDVIHELQERAKVKEWALDYDGALADLRLGDLGLLEPQLEGLLKQRSKIKRLLQLRAREKEMASDYEGALADLRPEDPGVIEPELEAGLWQKRIEVKTLLFQQRAMEKLRAFDYEGALASLHPKDPGMVEPLLEEFFLTEREKMIPLIYEIALARAKAKMRAGDYEGALADVDPEDCNVEGPEGPGAWQIRCLCESRKCNLRVQEVYLRVRGVIEHLRKGEKPIKKFRDQDYEGALADVRQVDPGVVEPGLQEHLWMIRYSILRILHMRAMEKVREKDYKGALADLRPEEAGVVEMSLQGLFMRGFLLQERGVVKRLMNDLCGAMEDLSAALMQYSKFELNFSVEAQAQRLSMMASPFATDLSTEVSDFTYMCRKHRGYVRFLLGDLDGAKEDGEMALKVRSLFGNSRNLVLPNVSDESVSYMGFRLGGDAKFVMLRIIAPDSLEGLPLFIRGDPIVDRQQRALYSDCRKCRNDVFDLEPEP